jgi:CDGSH-type Zn-finger protein
MADDESDNTGSKMRIVIVKDGPYVVQGNVPLVSKTQVVSEFGEPLTWQKDKSFTTPGDEYRLCRCGLSSNMPFCDDCHERAGLDGAQSTDRVGIAQRVMSIPGGRQIIVKMDFTICMKSGFCGLQDTDIYSLVPATNDIKTRALVIAMIEHCPSGALTYKIEPRGADIEPDLPKQIALTTEITSDGPIGGPLWVTGGIPIEKPDGTQLEVRNRITLCNCGLSSIKPLCDGTHRDLAQIEERRRQDSG